MNSKVPYLNLALIIMIAIAIILLIIFTIFGTAVIEQHIVNNQVRANPLGTCLKIDEMAGSIEGQYHEYTLTINNVLIIDENITLTGYTVKFPIKKKYMVNTREKTCRKLRDKLRKNDTDCHFNREIHEAYFIPSSLWNDDSGLDVIVTIATGTYILIAIIISIIWRKRICPRS